MWQVDDAGREMKDPKIWIRFKRAKGSIIIDLVAQNLFWSLVS